jgi:predicted deacylase
MTILPRIHSAAAHLKSADARALRRWLGAGLLVVIVPTIAALSVPDADEPAHAPPPPPAAPQSSVDTSQPPTDTTPGAAESTTHGPALPQAEPAPAAQRMQQPDTPPAQLPGPGAEAEHVAPEPAPGATDVALAQARTVPEIHPVVTILDAPAEPVVKAGGTSGAAAAAAAANRAAMGQLAGGRPVDEAGAPITEPATLTDVPATGGVLPFELLGETVQPGTFAQLTWYGTESFTTSSIPSAVLVAHGAGSGPVVCITAAVHGDELNGIETVRRIMHDLDPTRLSGTVVGVPIVNIQGFHRSSRYLPDRRDLNRYFPGNPNGSSASRIAYSLFYGIVVRCNALVDLHTGSFQRTNLPQVRADLHDPGVLGLTQGFGDIVILNSTGGSGTLRAAATRAGIPAVTLEAGAPTQVQNDAVTQSEQAIRMLLDALGVYREPGIRAQPTPAYYQSRWVRTDHGGILSGKVELGRQVVEGDLLGTVVDPLTNQLQEIRSPLHGRVIGMALDQFVMPGYATFHIGIEAPVDQVIDSTPAQEPEHEAAEVEQGFDPS